MCPRISSTTRRAELFSGDWIESLKLWSSITGRTIAWTRPVSVTNCGRTVIALTWATEGDEGDGVAGLHSAADGLHGAPIQEVDDGFPAIAGVVVEQTLELRRAGVVAQAFARVVTDGDNLVVVAMLSAGLLTLGRGHAKPRGNCDHD